MRTTLAILLLVGLAFAAPISLSSDFSPAGDGGPDGGGYYWYDQGYSGIGFVWDDISTTGTDLGLGDDDHDYGLELGFDFNFYGGTYTEISVGSNGTVYFEDTYLGMTYTHIPADNSYCIGAFIAPWWRDLDPTEGNGAVYFQAFSTYAIVQFDNVEVYGGGDPVTFQVILQEAPDSSTNSDLCIQYNSTTSLANGVIGIQGDIPMGTECEYDPIDCVPGDFYYFSPRGDYAVEEATWGQIKAM